MALEVNVVTDSDTLSLPCQQQSQLLQIEKQLYITTTMDTSSSLSSSSFLNIPHNHSMTMRNPTSSTSSSSAQTLYYYNVDAILSELIRPATPKHGNLARPRLVKPEAIRPQQLVGMGSSGSTTTTMHSGRTGRDHHQKSLTTPFALLNDRMEGARNPDPIQQQVISPFAIDDNEEEDNGDIGMMAYSNGVINTMDYYYNSSNSSSSKRSRDDEDILYYKKNHSSNKSITTASMTEDTESAALVTPNPIQYYTSTNATTPSSLTLPTTNSWTYEEPQYIVYKNLMDDTKNAVNNGNNETNHENYNYFQHGNNNNNNNVWTTNTPSTSVSYTIVKPIAMRPMDVIQHLDHHYYHYQQHPSTPEDDTNNACTLIKNALYHDAILDDGSMQVCG